MRAFLQRIEQENKRVHALITVRDSEDALAEARALDQEGIDPSRPLYGLPVVIKDLSEVKGMRTTYGGSPLFRNYISSRDDPHVAKIRAAGAIIVGKSNSPEWGAGSQTFNSVCTTLNPHDTSKTAGGSSGGAAAALATFMVPLADGSDFAGSLRNPASFCGVVGFRPTVRGDEMATEGAMARSVPDLVLLHSVMFDVAEWEMASPLPCSIAWAGDFGGRYPVEAEVLRAFHGARYVFQALDMVVADMHPPLEDADVVFDTLRAESYRVSHAEVFKTNPDGFKDTVVWNIQKGLKQTPQEVEDARGLRDLLQDKVDAWMGENGLHFIIAPSAQVVPFDVEVEWVREINGVHMENYIGWMRICSAITVLGLPCASVPCGATEAGLPVGLQVIGRAGEDRAVLELAHAFQEKIQGLE